MIVIYRRIKDHNNFVNFPGSTLNKEPTQTSALPMNRAHSFRFPFTFSYKYSVPTSATIKENTYYEEDFLEIIL